MWGFSNEELLLSIISSWEPVRERRFDSLNPIRVITKRKVEISWLTEKFGSLRKFDFYHRVSITYKHEKIHLSQTKLLFWSPSSVCTSVESRCCSRRKLKKKLSGIFRISFWIWLFHFSDSLILPADFLLKNWLWISVFLSHICPCVCSYWEWLRFIRFQDGDPEEDGHSGHWCCVHPLPLSDDWRLRKRRIWRHDFEEESWRQQCILQLSN